MIRLAKSLKKLFRPLAVIIFGPRGTWGADVLAPVVFALMGPPDRGSHIYVMYIMKAESDRSACCMKASDEVPYVYTGLPLYALCVRGSVRLLSPG